MFRGVKTILQLHPEDIQTGVLSPIIKAGISVANRGSETLPSFETDQLNRLRTMINRTLASQNDSQTLNVAINNLQWLFSSRIDKDGQKISLTFQNFGVWLYRCSDEFTLLLQRRHPVALAIFAHACLPLNDLSSIWAMEGWVSHLLQGIWERLPREYHSWIQWPIQEIGWIPPQE